MEAIDYAEYSLPSDMSTDSVVHKLAVLLRPCSPTITAHFVRLHAFKPFFDTDEERLEIVFEALYDDLKAEPEVAVVLAFDALRKTEGRYFPTVQDITQAVSEYREMIHECLNYFG